MAVLSKAGYDAGERACIVDVDFDIDAWLDENQARWPSKWTPGHKQPEVKGRRKIQGKQTIADRAREYLAKIDGAVEGQGGSKKTYYVACQLINGFDMSIDEAKPLIMEWNTKCQPEWSERDIDHKLEDASQSDHDKPSGHLLEDRPRKIHRNAVQPAKAPTEDRTAQGKGDGGSDDTIVQDPDVQPLEGNEVIANPPGDGIDYDDNRPEVEVVPVNEYLTNLEVITTIAEDPRIFQRGGVLVEDIRCMSDTNKKIDNNKGTFEIVPISQDKLRHLVSQAVKLYKMVPCKDADGDIDYKKIYIHIPDWCVKSIHRWGGYPGFKPLEGITEVPIIHADGSIFDTPGYDAETKMIFEPSANFPKVPENPTHDDAKSAAGRLLDIVCDFPWSPIDDDKGMTHKAAWLSSLFTVLCRHLVDGCCPMFLIGANMAGTGKSKLADIVSMIAIGRRMPRTPYKDNEDELKKSIMSILLAAKPFVLFDNVANGGYLGGSTIDALMTSRTYSDRILGTNKNPELTVNTVFYATGNQVNLKGDSLRRFIIAKIQSKIESPETRPDSDFKIKGDLINHVGRNRESFVVDVLTIMRAFIKAGRPHSSLIPMGSYEEWSSVIREAVYWCMGHDPAKSQHHLKKEDKLSIERANIVNGWKEIQDATGRQDVGFSIPMIVQILDGAPEKYALLRTSFLAMNKSNKEGFPPSSIIGKLMNPLENLPMNGHHFEKIEDARTGRRWIVKPNLIEDEDDRDIDESKELTIDTIKDTPF